MFAFWDSFLVLSQRWNLQENLHARRKVRSFNLHVAHNQSSISIWSSFNFRLKKKKVVNVWISDTFGADGANFLQHQPHVIFKVKLQRQHNTLPELWFILTSFINYLLCCNDIIDFDWDFTAIKQFWSITKLAVCCTFTSEESSEDMPHHFST